MNLDELLSRAYDELTGGTDAIDERALTRVRGVTRRARLRRHAVTSVGAVAAVGVLGVGAAYALGRGDAAPVPPATQTPTTAPSSDPTPTPTPAPSLAPTPQGPVERAAEIDDASVLARLAAPRTGETWHDPVRDDTARAALLAPGTSGWTVYAVGARGAASVYLVVEDATAHGSTAPFLYRGALLVERDEDGARAVRCPSARTGDPCVTPDELGVLADDVEPDDATFYDSLTLPATIDAGPGWSFRTASTRELPYAPAYGLPLQFGQPDATWDVVDLGPLALVLTDETPDAVEGVEPVEGLRSHRYAVRLPFGTLVVLEGADQPNAAFDAITWDDGVLRADDQRPYSAAPGAFTCDSLQLSTQADFDAGTWRAAGTTAEGQQVYLPVAGGNDVSRAVREYQSSLSWGEDLGGGSYRYPTDEDFLAANALWALQGPDGTWQLRLRYDAQSAVFECS
ncbi:hypothetical protein [Cellulomonas composti]|uniref:Uncharacterized protein n=1 Tax=Cellulomonas composti TaxID=266130 RepID=A0A511JDC7_9CELL|nr:hypothetical protein [Cellulomonas composti]GEL95723.1 hypothetical protein CCO02nite_23810 [Cellulomonas composti]